MVRLSRTSRIMNGSTTRLRKETLSSIVAMFAVKNSRLVTTYHLLMHKDGFKCTLCDVFSSPYSLSSHKIMKHRRSSTCTICERSFPSTTNFYQHVLTHEGIRPYKCDICGENFTQRSSVLRHRNTHPGPLPPFRETTFMADIAKNILMRLSNA